MNGAPAPRSPAPPLVRVAPTLDMAAVAAVMRAPECWAAVRDDFTPEDWAPAPAPARPDTTWLLVQDGGGGGGGGPSTGSGRGAVLGVIAIVAADGSGAMAALHIAMLRGARGARAAAAVRAAQAWCWAARPALWKLIALVPADNRPAGRLAAACGWRREGRLRAAFLRGGALHDLVLYGLERPEEP